MNQNLKILASLIIGFSIGFFVYKLQNNRQVTIDANVSDNCVPTLCCEEPAFCGISIDELKHYVSNYQNFNWSKTSKFYEVVDYTPSTKGAGFRRSLQIPNELNRIDTTDLFDAGFMDVPIADMENYICAIKNSASSGSTGDETDRNCCEKPSLLRFYYIRYDGPTGQVNNGFQDYDEHYDYKHSLAIVPVCIDQNGEEKECLREDDHYGSTFIWAPNYSCEKSNILNHNVICPPFLGCENESILKEVYEDRSLYSDDDGSHILIQNPTP